MIAPDPADVGDLKELDDGDLLLYRQVHPTYVTDGEPNHLAFRCTPADHGELSITQGDKTTPEAACRQRSTTKPGSTVGTWAVSVEEVHSLGLRAWDDTRRASVDDPAHGFIDCHHIVDDQTRRRTVAKILADRAAARGCQYRLTHP